VILSSRKLEIAEVRGQVYVSERSKPLVVEERNILSFRSNASKQISVDPMRMLLVSPIEVLPTALSLACGVSNL
jgi:hypothetical protein